MSEKNILIRVRNDQNGYDVVYPRTKAELVEGLQNELDNKVDKEEGKGLSTEDFTTAEKNKLAGIEENANYYIHPATHDASMIVENENKRFVSDSKIAEWDAKQDALGYTPENTANK